jgi:hypothetical protein
MLTNYDSMSLFAFKGKFGWNRPQGLTRETLTRITRAPPAAIADMTVLPGVLEARTWRRTEQVRLRPESRGNAGRLPGAATISTISLRRLVHNAG